MDRENPSWQEVRVYADTVSKSATTTVTTSASGLSLGQFENQHFYVATYKYIWVLDSNSLYTCSGTFGS